MTSVPLVDRATLVRRSQRLNYATMAYNSLEGIVAIAAILLAGLAFNALLGWWWADPIAALLMVPLIAWEGVEGMRGRSACGDDCHPASGAA